MKKRNVFLLGMLAVTLVFGITVSGCGALAGVAITEATQSAQNKKVTSVIEHAISEIEKVLPADSTVWINKGTDSAGYNVNALGVATSTAGVAETAVDDITAAFLQKGIRLVDRQNAALVQAEQKYQTGGNVTEDDMVSIGKAAGANILITVSVVPQGKKQRLKISVIDIEKGVPLMQSDSGKDWQI